MREEFDQEMDEIFESQPATLLNCNVYRKDILTLWHHQWLSSEAIHFLSAILEQQYSSLFSQQNQHIKCKILDPFITNMLIFMGDQQCILQTMRDQQLFNYRYIFIPTNTETQDASKGSHWFLMVFDRDRNILFTMDSAYECIHKNALTMGRHLQKMRVMFCQDEQGLKKANEVVQVQWLKGVVKQTNSYDCGIHTIGNLEYILKSLNQITCKQKEGEEDQSSSLLDVTNIHIPKEYFSDLRLKYLTMAIKRLQQQHKDHY